MRTYEEKGVEDWLERVSLKRRGREHVGPCPLCGGSDRFSVKPGRGRLAIVFCRNCIGGVSKEERDVWYGRLVREVFGEGERQGGAVGMRQVWEGTYSQRVAAEGVDDDVDLHAAPYSEVGGRNLVRELWEAGVPCDGTLGHAYLVSRTAWPPKGQGLPLVPGECRFLPVAKVPPRYEAGHWYGLPREAAGALMFAWRPAGGGDLAGVSLEALDGAGRDLGAERWRRTFGSRVGCVMSVPGRGGREGSVVALCEGALDALALSFVGKFGEVRAVGGTSGFTVDVCRGLRGRSLTIVPDSDSKGRRAAFRLRQVLEGYEVKVRLYGKGESGDPLDWVAQVVGERVAMKEGGGEGEAQGWREVLGRGRGAFGDLEEEGGREILVDVLELLAGARSQGDQPTVEAVVEFVKGYLKEEVSDREVEGVVEVAGRGPGSNAAAAELLRPVLGIGPLLPRVLGGSLWRQEPRERQWLVRDWLPAGELVLLSGMGEAGKSMFMLQLCCALACDRERLRTSGGWLPRLGPEVRASAPDLDTDAVRVMIASWEDDQDEVLRRRSRLVGRGGLKWADDGSIDERLEVLPMRGFGPVYGPVGEHHIDTRGEMTAAGRELLGRAAERDVKLLVLDPVSLAMATNENERSLVSLALETFAGWAMRAGCSIVFVGHPAKALEGEGSDYSGSTAWRGLTRALWTLKLPAPLRQRGKAHSLKAELKARKERVSEWTLNKSNYSYSFGEVSFTLETIGGCAAWYVRDEVENEE